MKPKNTYYLPKADFGDGQVKKLSDGSLIVTFGYNAEEMLKEMLI